MSKMYEMYKFHLSIIVEGQAEINSFDEMVQLTQFLIDRGYLLETESQPAQPDRCGDYPLQEFVPVQGNDFLINFLQEWKASGFKGCHHFDYQEISGQSEGLANIDLIFICG